MPKVLVGVTGGEAAYKVCEVTSTLAKAGVEVREIMPQQAQSIVTAVTLDAYREIGDSALKLVPRRWLGVIGFMLWGQGRGGWHAIALGQDAWQSRQK